MTSTVIDAGDGLPLTLPSLWRARVKEQADKILIVCDDQRLSYAEVDRRSNIVARGLLAAGAMKGSHVALLHPNGADFLIGAIAAARIGAVVVPLSTLSTANELQWLLTNSDAGFLLAAPEYRSRRFDELLSSAIRELDLSQPPPLQSVTAPWLRRIWFGGPTEEGHHPGWSVDALGAMASSVDEATLEAIEGRVSPADRLLIIHTSGSTSKPKGVIHTHGAIIRHLDNGNQIRPFTSQDVLFSTAPWFWVAGGVFALFGTLVAGARIVCSNSTDAEEVLDLLEREQPTTTNGYGATVQYLADHPSFEKRNLSSIRKGTLYPILAADVRPKDPELRHNIYGMTEVGGALTLGEDQTDLPERCRGSFGHVLPGYEYKIMDPETGKHLGTGEIGELWIRGPFIMEGYYGRPRSEVFEPDGWWRTGDLGMFDDEGFFYLKERLGNMIKTSGANVAPKEVEAVLRELTGGLQCFVFGLPDDRRGQIVVAAIVSECAIDHKELRKHLSEKLSSYKIPRRIVNIRPDEVPYLSSGKIDMQGLASLAH